MCLILAANQARPGSRLLLLANRDEFHARPSVPAEPWLEDGRVVGGRDLVAGGSWLAVHGDGRFVAVTNLRNGMPVAAPRSRGDLVRNFVLGEASPGAYLHALRPQVTDFAPFNLILGDADGLLAFDGSSGSIHRFDAGMQVIGNGPFEADWPKARRLRTLAASALENSAGESQLLAVLRDEQRPPDGDLPDTGIGLERERLLSPIFISGSTYGTRVSTLLDIRDDGRIELIESRFGPDAVPTGTTRWRHVAGSGWEKRESE